MSRFFILIFCLMLAANTHALNIKREKNGIVTTLIDDQTCTAQTTQQGLLGNIRVVCTNVVENQTTVPAICPNNGYPLQVLQGNLDWDVGAGIATYSATMRTGNAYVYTMQTGAPSNLATLVTAEYGGAAPYRTVVISLTPCDFNALNSANAWGIGTTAEANFSVGVANQFGYSVLQPHTTYYINIRNATWQDPSTDTCPAGTDCKFVMSLRHQ